MQRKWPLFPVLLALSACNLGSPTAPIPQPDTLVFGRITAIRGAADEHGVTEVEIRASLPETLQAVMRREKRPIPTLEKDLLVRVNAGPDTLAVVDMAPTDISAFKVGQEVAMVPRPGTCAMVGTKVLLAEAGELYLFSAYQLRMLPRSLTPLPAEIYQPDAPGRVNSAGTEQTPLALAGGKVVYLAAGLLPPLGEKEAARGALRPGMTKGDGTLAEWVVGGLRPYRTEWRGAAWSTPEPVAIPGLAPDASARITWVDATETSCLVEVVRPGQGRALLAASRASANAPWSEPTAVTLKSGTSIGDAQRFGSTAGALVWTAYDASGSDLWLALKGKEPGLVDPRINTLGAEWAPRVGPNNALYFCRGERQLVFHHGVVEEVRLPGRQRRPLLEAAPTPDGTLLFCRVPRFVPGEPDWDLAVARRVEGGGWGEATRLDEWRPDS